MDQEIKNLKLKDLVLWTENPRDPIDENATDQDIVDKALKDENSKWLLPKLAEEMGEYYDLSELPTVVNRNGKYVIYDGNRRIILGKIKLNLVKVSGAEKLELPEFPEELPCNVCTEDIALKNVYRKHSNSGSWDQLSRAYFLKNFRDEGKSTLLILEEKTGLITAYPHMNLRFVEEEVLNESNLINMGFKKENDELYTVHSDDEARIILNNLSEKIRDNKISTRINRHKVIETLDESVREIINKNKDKCKNEKNYKVINFHFENTQISHNPERRQRQTRRVKSKDEELFGKALVLKKGNVNNLYRDIADLYKIYQNNKKVLSDSFPSLIRMSLRLLCEAASSDENLEMNKYIITHFPNAKANLDKDAKTSLSTQEITGNSMVKLLHIGAHKYKAANNLPQTCAISFVLGEMLTITHGKTN